MAFSQAQLTAINTAIATGELEVEFDGKRVKYRSMNELMKARDLITGELTNQGLISSNRGPTTVAAFTRE